MVSLAITLFAMWAVDEKNSEELSVSALYSSEDAKCWFGSCEAASSRFSQRDSDSVDFVIVAFPDQISGSKKSTNVDEAKLKLRSDSRNISGEWQLIDEPEGVIGPMADDLIIPAYSTTQASTQSPFGSSGVFAKGFEFDPDLHVASAENHARLVAALISKFNGSDVSSKIFDHAIA